MAGRDGVRVTGTDSCPLATQGPHLEFSRYGDVVFPDLHEETARWQFSDRGMHAHHTDSAITVQGVSGHVEFTVADRAPNADRFDQAQEAVVSTRACSCEDAGEASHREPWYPPPF